MDFADIDQGPSLVTPRRELDASRRAPENLDPKKRMLGLTPALVFMVVDPQNRIGVFGVLTTKLSNSSRQLYPPTSLASEWLDASTAKSPVSPSRAIRLLKG